MPYKSEAQRRWMYAAEERGDVPKGTADRWQKETGDRALPEHKKEAGWLDRVFGGGRGASPITSGAPAPRMPDAGFEAVRTDPRRLEAVSQQKLKEQEALEFARYGRMTTSAVKPVKLPKTPPIAVPSGKTSVVTKSSTSVPMNSSPMTQGTVITESAPITTTAGIKHVAVWGGFFEELEKQAAIPIGKASTMMKLPPTLRESLQKIKQGLASRSAHSRELGVGASVDDIMERGGQNVRNTPGREVTTHRVGGTKAPPGMTRSLSSAPEGALGMPVQARGGPSPHQFPPQSQLPRENVPMHLRPDPGPAAAAGHLSTQGALKVPVRSPAETAKWKTVEAAALNKFAQFLGLEKLSFMRGNGGQLPAMQAGLPKDPTPDTTMPSNPAPTLGAAPSPMAAAPKLPKPPGMGGMGSTGVGAGAMNSIGGGGMANTASILPSFFSELSKLAGDKGGGRIRPGGSTSREAGKLLPEGQYDVPASKVNTVESPSGDRITVSVGPFPASKEVQRKHRQEKLEKRKKKHPSLAMIEKRGQPGTISGALLRRAGRPQEAAALERASRQFAGRLKSLMVRDVPGMESVHMLPEPAVREMSEQVGRHPELLPLIIAPFSPVTIPTWMTGKAMLHNSLVGGAQKQSPWTLYSEMGREAIGKGREGWNRILAAMGREKTSSVLLSFADEFDKLAAGVGSPPDLKIPSTKSVNLDLPQYSNAQNLTRSVNLDLPQYSSAQNLTRSR